MAGTIIETLKQKLFKKLGLALKIAVNDMDMMALWKPRKHRTFKYDPQSHSYIEKPSTVSASPDTTNAMGSVTMPVRMKTPEDIKLAVHKLDTTFSNLEVTTALMVTEYQTENF